MANDLTRITSRALDRREDREQSRDLRAVQRPAKRAAARIQAAAITAHTGLVSIEALTACEVAASQRQGAIVDARARMVVDAFTGLVANELALLALER